MKQNRIITLKDYMIVLGVSKTTAVKLRRQDKKELKIPKHRYLLESHFVKLYFHEIAEQQVPQMTKYDKKRQVFVLP